MASNSGLRRSASWVVLLIVGMLFGAALVGTASADPAGPPGGLDVTEQNVDGSGDIKVHEQGVADVNVTNASLGVAVDFPSNQQVTVTNTPLPVSGTVTADVSGLSVSLSSPVDVNGPVEVKGTVALSNNEAGFRLTNDTFALCDTCVFAAGSTSFSVIDGPITAVSFYSDRRASIQFQKDSDAVHTIFLEAGNTVNMTFPHPVDADHMVTSCSSGGACNIRYSISGYTQSP